MGRTKHLIENNQDNEFYLQAEKVFLDEEYYYYQKQKKEKKRAHGLRFIPHRAIEIAQTELNYINGLITQKKRSEVNETLALILKSRIRYIKLLCKLF